MIIAIDGTVASGKSTAAKKLAAKLGFLYINTGLMYRGVAAYARVNNIPTTEAEQIASCVKNLKIDLKNINGAQHVFINGKDLTHEALAPDIGIYVSNIADNPGVREVLVKEQRRLGLEAGNAVLEGRDIGSDVFPDADVKFFVIAKARERAKRRLEDDRKRNPELTLDAVEKAVLDRDKRDRERPVGALKKMPGAIEIDTTDLSPEETIELMTKYLSVKIHVSSVIKNLKFNNEIFRSKTGKSFCHSS